MDACISTSVIESIPYEQHQRLLDVMYETLRPGGYLYMEMYTLMKPKLEMHETKQKAYAEYYHIPHAPVLEELRNYVTSAGFEVVKMDDCGEKWSENCWGKSQIWLQELQDDIETMQPAYKKVLQLHAVT